MAEPEKKRLSPQAARALERREAQLKDIADQIEDGTLTVRKMTKAEREKFAKRRAERPAKPARRAR